MCLVCGLKNDLGLKGVFYELDNNELLAVFRPLVQHESYPGRLHVGIASTILDETIGRAIMLENDTEIWGVTVELSIRFKKPIPLTQELRVVARIVSEDRRFFVGNGELLLEDGSIAAQGRGRYLKQPLEQIAEFDPVEQEWRVVPTPEGPEFVDV
jgi:acyl-coenzyme A thioesterase PaaI-like protein